jgi:hypothetical protein
MKQPSRQPEILWHGSPRAAKIHASASADRQGLAVLHQDRASVVLDGDDVIEVHGWVNGHE